MDWTDNSLYRSQGVIIGDNVGIWGKIDEAKPDIVTIGDYVVIGARSVLVTHCPIRMYGNDIRIVIGNNVYIGMGCYVLPGVKIGDNVMIGAGSVVTKNIPSGMLVAGNPCKVIRSLAEKEVQRILLLSKQHQEAIGQEPKEEEL
jgi:acetyltransferase-like isoleucine patch superfamily enzyme